MKSEAKWAIGIAIVIVLILVLAYWWRRRHEKMARVHHAGKFHGWRMQHYDDNPYAGQTYRCGRCAVGYHCSEQREGCPSNCMPPVTGPTCPPGCKLRHRHYFGPTGGIESFCPHDRPMCGCADWNCEHRAGTYLPQCHGCAEAGIHECRPTHTHVEACDAQGRANIRAHCATKEGFGGMDWPVAGGTYGATADTYPYGNYADGEQMFYPTYFDQPDNHYWTRF